MIEGGATMTYEVQNYDALLGTPGFSDKALQNHFKLYAGYVKNTNKVLEKLQALAKANDFGPEYAELKRRFGWEFNGMRLHELHFGSMKNGGEKFDPESKIGKKIIEQFGSYENWLADFKATGKMRGIGWVILYYDQEADRLMNVWINEHEVGHPASIKPLVNCDMFEHAYMVDYMMDREPYLNAFLAALDWTIVEKRFAE